MTDVFISYSSADRLVAESLARSLMLRKWDVWWDHHVPVGSQYEDVIGDKAEAAKVVVVLWSKSSAGSNWVQAESSIAVEQEKLVSVSIDATSVPTEFRNQDHIDLRGWVEESEIEHPGLRLLADRVSQVISSQHPPQRGRVQPDRAALTRYRTTRIHYGLLWLAIAHFLFAALSLLFLSFIGNDSDPRYAATILMGLTPLTLPGICGVTALWIISGIGYIRRRRGIGRKCGFWLAIVEAVFALNEMMLGSMPGWLAGTFWTHAAVTVLLVAIIWDRTFVNP